MERLLVCVLAILASVNASWDIPARAKGGRAGRISQRKDGAYKAGDQQALTWQAAVDNFGNTTARYAQRYFVNDAYWDRNTGPVFLNIGGEGTLSGPPGGYIEFLGKNYSALLISLEHRFYGESIPNNDMSTPNLKYLTVEQALADVAAFIDFYTASNQLDGNTWFTFGGSYPGALSAWFMVLYPEHSAGSLSSSGVVNAILKFPEFDQQVSAAVGNKCADQIRRIQSAFERANADSSGYQESLSMFNCDPNMLTNDFYFMIADSWSMMDQYSSKAELCDTILAVGTDADDSTLMQTFAALTMDFWGANFCYWDESVKTGCFYDTHCLRDPDMWDVDARSWRWQTCYQLSYFQVAPEVGSLRAASLDMSYMVGQCWSIFGERMIPSTKAVNELLGGAYPQAKNVFYTDFSDDPWNKASVTFPLGENQPFSFVMCDGCGHCKDLHTPTDDDPEALKESRAEFEEYLAHWLSEA